MEKINQQTSRDPLYAYSLIGLLLGLGLFFSLIFLFPSLETGTEVVDNQAKETLNKLEAQAVKFQSPVQEANGFLQGNKLIEIRQSRIARIRISPKKDSLHFYYPSGSLSIPVQKGQISNTSSLPYYGISSANRNHLDKVFTRSFNEVIFPSFRNYEDMLLETKPDFVIGSSKKQKIDLLLNQLGIAHEVELRNLLNARQKPTYQEVILNAIVFLLKDRQELYLHNGKILGIQKAHEIHDSKDLLVTHLDKTLRAEIQSTPPQNNSKDSPWQAWFFPLFSGIMFIPLGLSFFKLRKKKESRTKTNTPIGEHATPIVAEKKQAENGSRKLGSRTRIFVHEIESAKDSEELSFVLTENTRVAAHEIKEVTQILHRKIDSLQKVAISGNGHANGNGNLEATEQQLAYKLAEGVQGEQIGMLNEILDKLKQKEGQNGLYSEISKLSLELERQGSEYKNFLQTQFKKQEEFLYKQLEAEREKGFELEKSYQELNQKHTALLGEKLGLDQDYQNRVERLSSYQSFISQLCQILSQRQIDSLLVKLDEFLQDSSEIISISDRELKKIQNNIEQLKGPHQAFLEQLELKADIRTTISSFISYMDSVHKTALQKPWSKITDKLTLYESFELHLKGESRIALGKLIDICKNLDQGPDKLQQLEKLINVIALEKNSQQELQKHLKNAHEVARATQPTKTAIEKISSSLKKEEDVKLAFISLVDQVLAMISELSIYPEAGLQTLNFRSEVVKPLINSLIYQQIRLAISEESSNSLLELDKVLTELIPGLNREKTLSEYQIGPERIAKFGTMIDIYKQVVQSKGQNDLDADYIKNLYKNYGQMFKKLNRLDPLNLDAEDKIEFYTELFHLGLHSCDYLRYRSLPSIEIHEERLNVNLIRKAQKVRDLDPKSYKAFSFAPDISQASKVVRKLATELGIKEMEGVLVNGVYLSPDVLK